MSDGMEAQKSESKNLSELIFDPARDVTDQDVELIEKFMSSRFDLRDSADTFWKGYVLEPAVALSILSPEVSSKVTLGEKDFQALLLYLKKARPKDKQSNENKWRADELVNGYIFDRFKNLFPELSKEEVHKFYDGLCGWRDFTQWAQIILQLFPERVSEFKLDEEAWEGMRGYLEYQYRSVTQDKDFNTRWGGHPSFSDHAVAMKILFPDRANDLHLDDKIFEWMKRGLKKERKDKQGGRFSAVAGEMKLLFPGRVSEIGITEEDWRMMNKDTVNAMRHHKQADCLASHFANMKILAAEEVVFSDKGLQVNINKS